MVQQIALPPRSSRVLCSSWRYCLCGGSDVFPVSVWVSFSSRCIGVAKLPKAVSICKQCPKAHAFPIACDEKAIFSLSLFFLTCPFYHLLYTLLSVAMTIYI